MASMWFNRYEWEVIKVVYSKLDMFYVTTVYRPEQNKDDKLTIDIHTRVIYVPYKPRIGQLIKCYTLL